MDALGTSKSKGGAGPRHEWPIGSSVEEMTDRAVLAIAFADGLEEAGFVMSARRMRTVARDVIELGAKVRGYESVERERQRRESQPSVEDTAGRYS
jgi:hypothetical protein